MISIDEWLALLRSVDRTTSIPLIVGGAVLMMFGWRMWKVCVVVSFASIGGLLGWQQGAESGNGFLFALFGAVVMALLSFKPVNAAVAVLGGMIGGAIVANSFRGLGFSGPTLWCLAGAALLGCTAMAYLYRQRVVVLVTSFLGAALLMSGLITVAMISPTLAATLRSVGTSYAIVVPFLLLVPTVMSSFYQISEIHRLDAEI